MAAKGRKKSSEALDISWGNNCSIDKMVSWLNNGWNVLLKGHYGVGKTSMVEQAVVEFGLQPDEWIYFSASTLDPWVDLVGVPRL